MKSKTKGDSKKEIAKTTLRSLTETAHKHLTRAGGWGPVGIRRAALNAIKKLTEEN